MAAVRNVVIVGGGIAGLALASALQRDGVATRIVEKATPQSRLGAGISLLGNALRALDMIGLADACIASGYGYNCVKTRDSAGVMVDEMHPPRTFRPDRPGAFGIMRTVHGLSKIRRYKDIKAGLELLGKGYACLAEPI